MAKNPATPSEKNPSEPPRPLKIPLIRVEAVPHISITDIKPDADAPATNKAAMREQGRAIAVALKHDINEVPTVVASGYGKTAEKILELAYQSGVKVRQDGDLAQVLAAVDVNSPIPLSCFEAVAEILNYLYKLNATPPQFSR